MIFKVITLDGTAANIFTVGGGTSSQIGAQLKNQTINADYSGDLGITYEPKFVSIKRSNRFIDTGEILVYQKETGGNYFIEFPKLNTEYSGVTINYF